MSLPTPGDVHVNAPLTNMSVAYMNSLEDFVADRAAPVLGSDKQSNVFYKFTKDYWFRDEMKLRGPGGKAARAGYGVTTDSFFCNVWAVAKDIDDQVRANEDTPLDSDRTAMRFVTDLERIRREKSFKTAFLATSTWGSDFTGVSAAPGANQFLQWNDAASNPLEDVAAQIVVVKKRTGKRPNILLIGAEVWQILKNHPDIIARVSGGSTNATPATVTKRLVAQLMELEELLVAEAVENTAIEGAAFAGSFIVGKVGLLFVRDTTRSIESVTSMRTFTWRMLIGTEAGTRILKYRDEPHTDIVECESAFSHKLIASDTGVFFNTVVA